MDRQDFVKRMALLTGGWALFPKSIFANGHFINNTNTLENVGIQLFSVPAFLEKDFKGTIGFLAEMGFGEVELFGPYPYSSESGKQRWKAVTPMLGFSGSGYFGLSETEVKSTLTEYGLTVPAMHTDLDTLENKITDLGKAKETLGFEYVVLPAIPDERRKTLDDYKRMAETFNLVGKQAKEEGLKFAYHNHGYGLSEVGGQIPLQLILDNTDPDLVFLEMDLFWTIAGKADPITYLKTYSDRYHLMHVKDMKEIQTFSGDGGDASQWIPLFPNMTSAGSGVVDLKTIIPMAKKYGVKHFFVEQDMVQDPQVALKKSIDYLKSI